jgi:hypothetical protein
MTRNTSITLGDHFASFVDGQVKRPGVWCDIPELMPTITMGSYR